MLQTAAVTRRSANALRPVRAYPPGTWREFKLTPPDFKERTVRIYAPSVYRHGVARPALFLFDGQNVFGDEGSFSGGWHVHEAVDRMTSRKVWAPIVVAIDHGYDKRIEELSPFQHGEWHGRANAFLDWIVKDVVSLVRREYTLLPGAVGAVIGGSSMGGLAAMYAHYRHPDVFGGALSMSPSFWIGRGAIYKYIAERQRPWYSRVYLDAGAREGRMLGLAERMAHDLARRGYGRDQLMWRPDSRGRHSESDWRRRLPKALRFMFRIGN